jgi:hypothetical protein
MKWFTAIVAIVILHLVGAPTWGAMLGGVVVLLMCERSVNQYEQSRTHYHDEP